MLQSIRYAALLTASFFIFGAGSVAQSQDRAAETSTEVPALKKFHAVIYEIWHGAWPKKDTKQLADLLPKVESGVQDVAKAELPGILRERKSAWDEQVKGLQDAASRYKEAVEKKEPEQLLTAAEKLHMQYEKLVRAIRPPLQELENFHSSLYVLYHYYMPGDSLAMMKESAAELRTKMEALNKAVLPPRLKERQERFTAVRSDLSRAVDMFVAAAAGNDLKILKTEVRRVHEEYQRLEGILE